MVDNEYRERVYAGVLGKLIGVFYGRPVEGWPYEKIKDTFGIIERYIYREAGTPLIVADDDVAGTFTFLNAVEDCRDVRALTAQDFGEAWLDYVIEDKTIFWWGGLGRSTEHTAYLRLKAGIKAPLSGSIQTNGQAVAEQIGAQIFMDALAMMCPNDPETARYLVKQLAGVSHDGIAVESACFLAGMEAMAYGERDIVKLIDNSRKLGMSDRMKKIVTDVSDKCAVTQDFREVRRWLDEAYGYRLYPGNCHVIPNLALILACLLLGGDDFAKAMNLCVSAGWDTDCNGANLGCLNGIRLGLSAINASYDYRTPLADRLYNISSDGGNCVSNAEKETNRIVAMKQKLYGEAVETDDRKMPRFAFSLPGSVQGFTGCPFLDKEETPAVNGNRSGLGNGLVLEACGGGSRAVSAPVMWDVRDRQANYCLTGSPLLYEGQTVTAEVEAVEGVSCVRLYIVYCDFHDKPVLLKDGFHVLLPGDKTKRLKWKIPSLEGRTIIRIGMETKCSGPDKAVSILRKLDWTGAPERFEISGSLRNYDMSGFNRMMESFVSSARQFSFDSRVSFTVSHTEENGVATTGTQDWRDYSVSSVLIPGLHKRCGLVGRCRGHRRYYGLVLEGNHTVSLIRKKGGVETCLGQVNYEYENDSRISLCLRMKGSLLEAVAEGKTLLEVQDEEYTCGGAGFVVDCGTALADGFLIEAV